MTFQKSFQTRNSYGSLHAAGKIRYEAILTQTKKEEKNGETPMSVIFPPFHPDEDYYLEFYKKST